MMGNTEDEAMKERAKREWPFDLRDAETGCLLVAAGLPIGRLGRPDEIADTVMWMVKNAYATNKVIAVDGGYHPY